MNAKACWQPAAPAERYRHIDVLRGLALFGVLMVNVLTDFREPLLEHILRRRTGLTDWLVAATLEFKAVTIFSFLFGVGIAIQSERLRAPVTFLLRRLLWLFAIGTVHLFLIWNGDILALYAVCGLLLIPALRLPWLALFALGAAAMAASRFIHFGLHLPFGPEAADLIKQAHQVYGQGGFPDILEFRWRESWALIVPLLVMFVPRTAGLMFWGMAAWRSGILREPARHRGKLLAALALAAAGAVATRFTYPVLLALVYTSALLLWLSFRRAPLLKALAAMGRMSLSNYLLQSIVLGFIFYGYGLGLFGKVSSAAAAAIAVALYAVQLQLSRWWLEHYRFGPFEWLWRSLAYGHRQPMRY